MEARLPLERIPTLDILRGIAVMGILAMNIPAFAMPEAAYTSPAAYGGSEGLDLFAWIASFILFDGKMRGFFGLLFGASMLLVIDRAEARGENGAAVHLRRMAWLLVIGLAHFYLFWWGDILSLYALAGTAAFLLHRLPAKWMIAAIVLLLGWQGVKMGMTSARFLAAESRAEAPGASADAVARWQRMDGSFRPPADRIAADLALHRSGYGTLVHDRVANRTWEPFTGFLFIGAETVAYMLIGMLGLRSGFLIGAWTAEAYRRVAFWGLALGGGGFMALAALDVASGFNTATVAAVQFSGTQVPRLLMIFGYAALFILLARKGGWLIGRIAAAGRMALSNYLGATLVLTPIFYGYGLGLYGHLDRAALYPIVFATWILMLLWSQPWLARHRYGPFEWLWRSLARGRAQPMRLSAQIA
ncbi:DUF418 domain-containing protein [Allosphingosinicella flava]|uniref:DUF418 domain-containing protein n=1 Tax=Allosphingosinicella flava TaxID=2771430 RepID=A0A7T2GHN4_9SPHN|nr:DUF418 domain-containing protein [Sphingosinicella flava]QPQ54075.1 DUF418 domain-containing protein [Sphingosinicella flava]